MSTAIPMAVATMQLENVSATPNGKTVKIVQVTISWYTVSFSSPLLEFNQTALWTSLISNTATIE